MATDAMQFHSLHCFSVLVAQNGKCFLRSESVNVDTRKDTKYCARNNKNCVRVKQIVFYPDIIFDVFPCTDVCAFILWKHLQFYATKKKRKKQFTLHSRIGSVFPWTRIHTMTEKQKARRQKPFRTRVDDRVVSWQFLFFYKRRNNNWLLPFCFVLLTCQSARACRVVSFSRTKPLLDPTSSRLSVRFLRTHVCSKEKFSLDADLPPHKARWVESTFVKGVTRELTRNLAFL